MSVVESISILDALPRAMGYEKTIVFYNDSERFHYEKPDELVDLRSGTVCSPNNFAYAEPLTEGVMRISALANYDRWAALDPETYRSEKRRWYDRLAESAVRFVPDFRHAVIESDMFTPLTIHRFTGHADGAVYGSAQKAPRRHHAPEKSLYLRQRSRAGGHRRHDHQRHQHRQSALVEMSGPWHKSPETVMMDQATIEKAVDLLLEPRWPARR